MTGSKPAALPLGYSPMLQRRLMGFEPTHAETTTRCVNHFATVAIILLRTYGLLICLTGVVGIEPTSMVLETIVLPLNYTPIMEGVGFEPTNPKERIYSPPRLATSLSLQWRRTESNCRHTELQSVALPTELLRLGKCCYGPDGNRTRDLLRDRQA